MSQEIGLISCTKTNLDEAAPPAKFCELSVLFRKARQYAIANHDERYILFAKYHVLDSEGPPIEPYEQTLRGASLSQGKLGVRRLLQR